MCMSGISSFDHIKRGQDMDFSNKKAYELARTYFLARGDKISHQEFFVRFVEVYRDYESFLADDNPTEAARDSKRGGSGLNMR